MRIFYDKRFLAVLWVVTVWAMLYLPSLDTADASRNECRRILPAITMLETGNWGTPMLSGKPYLRKPPMMNWFIASAYAITGMRSVLTARFATTLFVLALALTMLLLPSQLFDFNIRIVVSTALLVTFGMIGLGRSADIDPNYVCCAGFAVLFWLDAWSRNRTGWRLWLPASIPLAVGMLLKGPLIFLVYYVLVVAILHFERRKKELASPWHPIAFAVALTPFLVWSLLFLDKTSNAAHSAWEVHSGAVTWAHEIMLRMRFGEISFGKWLSRVAGSFAQFLPWLLFFPLLWNKRLFDGSEEKTLTFARAAKFAVPAVLILIDAMPATKARYSAPLIPIVVLAFGAITARIAVGGKMESSLKKIVYCAIATTACVSVFLLLSLLWLKFASMGALGIDESKISAFLAALKGMQLAPPLLSVVVAVAAFIIYKKHSNSLNGTPELILSATFAMVVGICVFLVFIHPLTKATRHYARNTANYIDAFTSEGAVVCGVGYVGEEPFTAHLKSSWVMVDKVEDLKTCPEVFVLSEDSLEDLERFSKKNALREVERKKIVYKKDHFYQLVRFEQEVCKVGEPQ